MTPEEAYSAGVQFGKQMADDPTIPTHDEWLFVRIVNRKCAAALFRRDHPMANEFNSELLSVFLRGELDGIIATWWAQKFPRRDAGGT